jgi:SAM-dependent methyltransferase
MATRVQPRAAEEAGTPGRAARPGKRLHFGCFDKPLDGWLNTDITPHLRIARVPLLATVLHAAGKMTDERLAQHRAGVFRKVHRLDITRRFPYESGTFEAAFSSHVMEHLYPGQARNCAAEVFRILAPGGVFRVVVPDLDSLIARYRADQADAWVEMFFESRQIGPQHQHHWMYNESSLRALLLGVGFAEVERCEYRQGRCPDVELLDNRPGSLFMEAVKR